MQHRILIACAVGVLACEPWQPVVVAEPFQTVTCGSNAFYDFTPGQAVAARWRGARWYVANVSGRNGDEWNVDYADGDRSTVPASDVIARGGTFAVGDHVIARWAGAAMSPGTIVRVSGWTCTVRWDDGDQPLDVPSDMIAHAP